MTKTVAERLREKQNGVSLECFIANTMMGLTCHDTPTCGECFNVTAKRLADMIEAEQAELRELCCDKADLYGLPIDADGEPCWLDDAVWHKRRKHLVVAVSHKGKVCIRDWETRDSGNGAVWVPAKYVSHKEPEVLDADGVPIKVGDTVYTSKGKELVVKDIQCNFFDDGEDPEHLVWCGEYIKEGYPLHQLANQLTHRKPDTQDAIEGRCRELCELAKVDDKTYCMLINGFAEVLERQRKLMGGE